MSKIITPKEFANGVMEILEEVVAEYYPEEEREEAKCRLLNAFSGQMFYGSVKKKRNDK